MTQRRKTLTHGRARRHDIVNQQYWDAAQIHAVTNRYAAGDATGTLTRISRLYGFDARITNLQRIARVRVSPVASYTNRHLTGQRLHMRTSAFMQRMVRRRRRYNRNAIPPL